MAQSLVGLPKKTRFEINGILIEIKNHKVTEIMGLVGKIKWIANTKESDRDTLTEFEKYRISFETAIECCVQELENNPIILGSTIWWYDIKTNLKAIIDFSATGNYETYAELYIEKLRDCQNWGELYDELNNKSRFARYMKRLFSKGLKQDKVRS